MCVMLQAKLQQRPKDDANNSTRGYPLRAAEVIEWGCPNKEAMCGRTE